jgi:hypothetical protein
MRNNWISGRGMPAASHPQGTRHPDEAIIVTFVVEIQAFYGGPAYWCLADNPLTLCCPRKVCGPHLPYWMK